MIIIDNPEEIWGAKKGPYKNHHILGAKMTHFEICTNPRKDDDYLNEEAYCASEEIFIDFDNGKEMRIYIGGDKKLHVYTD